MLDIFFSDIRKTLAISTVFHLLLALLLVFIGTGFDFSSTEFAEVAFVSASRSPRPRTISQGPSQQIRTANELPKSTEGTVKPKATEATTKQEPVQLPKRRMLEQEEPEPIPRTSEKLTPATQGQETPSIDKTIAESRYEGRSVEGRLPGERVTASTSTLPQGGKEMAPSADIGGPTAAQPFFIEGDASQRTIQKKVIPKYPAGLQKEAIVKIRFTVLPDGRIGEMIPLRKGGDATLEQVTMNALRQWRFNPLSPSVPQVSVQGIITFNYILR